MKRVHRVATIGADGFQRVDQTVEIECFPWSRIEKITNAADYDSLVLNLTSIKNVSEQVG
jgi:hypothetical protein